MAALGFNTLAIQEDLISSLVSATVPPDTSGDYSGHAMQEKRGEARNSAKEVLQMLTMFDVLSVQVVFALLDLAELQHDGI